MRTGSGMCVCVQVFARVCSYVCMCVSARTRARVHVCVFLLHLNVTIAMMLITSLFVLHIDIDSVHCVPFRGADQDRGVF